MQLPLVKRAMSCIAGRSVPQGCSPSASRSTLRSEERTAQLGLAEEFAMAWWQRLRSEPFDHPDPVHNAPSREELEILSGSTANVP